MMMRQFLRVKQIADQTFQRSEKGEALTEELSAAEKRVELIKQSCSASGKKLSACTQRLAQDSADKRTAKKIPEAALAKCMEEWGLHLGESSILGLTLIDCARIQEMLACDLLVYKTEVEDTVVETLQNVLKVDFANIVKQRKQLSKLTTEMNTAKIRYQNAAKNCQQTTSNGSPSAFAKADLLRDESEDSVSRFEQCRDALAAEIFNLISREPEVSHIFARLCHLQLEYHRKALSVLEASLPELETQIRSCPYHPVFGCGLESHLEVTKREIAVVIETCVCWLLETAMEEEGLFRIGGSLTKIKKIKSAFDAGLSHLLEDDRDPHNIAGVLKLYLRSLPEPLLSYKLYDDWIEAAMIHDHDTRLQSLWRVVNSLPEPNFKNLKYLIKFLAKLSQNSDVNKMSSQNIAIVIGPNLLWPEVDDCVLGMNMTATNLYSSIVDTLISYSDWFFPGDCEFQVSTPTSPRHIEGFPLTLLSGSQLSLSTAKLSNGDSAVDSLSSSPTNSSPKSPSPRIPIRPRKKSAPMAPASLSRNNISRSLSCGVFQPNVPFRRNFTNGNKMVQHSVSHEDLLKADYSAKRNGFQNGKDMEGDSNSKHKSLSASTNGRLRGRPKLPSFGSGLPPVAERAQKSISRPSYPPPEVPDSYITPSYLPERLPSHSDPLCSLSERPDLYEESVFLQEGRPGSHSVPTYPPPEIPDRNGKPAYLLPETLDSYDKPTYTLPEASDQYNIPSNMASERTACYENPTYQSSKRFGICQDFYPPSNRSDSYSDKPTLENSDVVELDDISVSLDSSESDTYNDCQMTLPEDLESDENKSPVVQNTESESAKDQLFYGGTPTWFDHYEAGNRQSDTIWFQNQETDELSANFENSDVFAEDIVKLNKHNDNVNFPECDTSDFRTVIEVNNGTEESNAKVSGTAIKLRVNSHSQNTRL